MNSVLRVMLQSLHSSYPRAFSGAPSASCSFAADAGVTSIRGASGWASYIYFIIYYNFHSVQGSFEFGDSITENQLVGLKTPEQKLRTPGQLERTFLLLQLQSSSSSVGLNLISWRDRTWILPGDDSKEFEYYYFKKAIWDGFTPKTFHRLGLAYLQLD